MKKLMIAAAAAAMVGVVTAGQCAPDTPSTDCAAVYKFKATVKTTKGLAQGNTTAGSQCVPGTTSCAVLRTKDSTKFEGWIYDCSCGCETIKDGTVVAWDSKRKVQLKDAAFTWNILSVMGKKQNEAEAAWAFTGAANYDESRCQTYTIAGAGVGSFSKGLYKSISGYFAGTATASYDLKTDATKQECACDPSQIWICTDLTALTDADTVAYGSWSIKYDSSASKKYLNDGTIKVPDYVTLPDAE